MVYAILERKVYFIHAESVSNACFPLKSLNNHSSISCETNTLLNAWHLGIPPLECVRSH